MRAPEAYYIYVRPHVPEWLHRWAARVWWQLHAQYQTWLEGRRRRSRPRLVGMPLRAWYWRIRPFPTWLLGPQWRRSRDLVEIDITYSCNLKCYNCDRSCEQDPSSDHMSVGQVRHFLEESRAAGVLWKRIRVLGGEPTNHPNFLEIMKLIRDYRDGFSPETSIQVCTNGHGERVKRTLSLLPPDVVVNNSAKTTKVQTHFDTFNVAPVDVKEYAGADFSNGCWVTECCGMGVTPYGYYPCAVAGAIDRTFGLDLGRKTLPRTDDPMKEELRTFCKLCGHFKPPTDGELEGPVMSATWAQAYARSRQKPPQLSRLAERQDL